MTHPLLPKLRTHSGWWSGDSNAERVLNEYAAELLAASKAVYEDRIAQLQAEAARAVDAEAKLRAVASALSFDPAEDRDLETCARRVYAMRVYGQGGGK